MISWIRAKWLARAAKRKKEKARKRLETLRKQCIHCRLWKDEANYLNALSGATFMPKVSLTIRPCKLHGTHEEMSFYEEHKSK